MARQPRALVFDTWAVFAFLEGEPAAEKVSELIADAQVNGTPLLMSVVNACEVWYVIARGISDEAADKSIAELRQLGIQLVDADWGQCKSAAWFKSRYRMSLADCFAAGLAKEHKAELVTGDREFRQVEQQIRIEWL